MNLLSWISSLFGNTSDKGIVEQVSDTAERWIPSPVKEHEMNMEQLKAEDASQSSARSFQSEDIKSSGVKWLDIFNTLVNCLNRLPRPAIATWAVLILMGIIPQPTHLNGLNPIVLNIVWTVVGFYFGIRTISQDIPAMIRGIKG